MIVTEQENGDQVIYDIDRRRAGAAAKTELIRFKSSDANARPVVQISGVTASNPVDGSVTTAKIAALAVTEAKIAAGAVTAAKLGSSAVTTAKLDTGAVTTAKLADDAVTAAKAPVFVSTEQTATGSAQNVAHGLGSAPSLVLVVPTAGHDGAGGAGVEFPTITEGVHTGTNVVVTVEAGAKFKVLAWL